MKRTGFKPKPHACTEGMPTTARLSVPVFRPKRCDTRKGGCGERFTPTRTMQPVCHKDDCRFNFAMRTIGKADKARKAEAKKARTADLRMTRAQLEAMKSLNTLREEAQLEFRRFCRLRDKAAGIQDCICCGEPLDWNSTKPGGAVDGGHWKSRGACPELAFDERNCSAQRKGCNRPGGTTDAKFRAGMLRRWGADVVAELEGPHELLHLKHDDYRALKAHYRAECRRMEKA